MPPVWTITSTTLRQTPTPGAMLGRVSATFLTVNMGARPLGAALGGYVGAHWGEAACLGQALTGFVLQAAVIAASPVRTLVRLPAPAARYEPAFVALALDGVSYTFDRNSA